MQLQKETITHIQKAVKTAKLLGIDTICIEEGLVRAMSDDRSVLIVDANDVELPFEALGVSRIPQFIERYNITSEGENFTMSLDESDAFVKSVVLKCKGTKIDYKCSNPSNIVAPRKLVDVMTYGIDITDESIQMLKRSVAAMGADELTIVSNDDGVSIEMNDVNNDIFKHELNTIAAILDGESTSFAFRYPAKLLISLLQNSTNHIEIAKKGSLKLNINGFDTFVIQKV